MYNQREITIQFKCGRYCATISIRQQPMEWCSQSSAFYYNMYRFLLLHSSRMPQSQASDSEHFYANPHSPKRIAPPVAEEFLKL